MSGGVDSSVAAASLIEKGYRCEAVFMHMMPSEMHLRENIKGHLEDANKVAKLLGLKLHILDMSWEMQQVISEFTYEYSMGRTPNPCIRCNAKLKFGKLLAFARDQGADFLATGHYVRKVMYAGFPMLARAKAAEKDQSYFLFGISRKNLDSILFPNGESLSKDEIREKAKVLNLPIHDKEDSQEICFVPNDDYVSFLSKFHPELNRPGQIVDTSGKILGQHKGIFRYTIGQRRGLGIAAGEPIYVVKIDPLTSRITVGSRAELTRRDLIASGLNWHINPPLKSRPIEIQAQIRSTHKPAKAKLELTGTNYAKLTFEEPQYAITPGQAVVFYQDDILLGGGWIQSE